MTVCEYVNAVSAAPAERPKRQISRCRIDRAVELRISLKIERSKWLAPAMREDFGRGPTAIENEHVTSLVQAQFRWKAKARQRTLQLTGWVE